MTARIDAIRGVIPTDSEINTLNGTDVDMTISLESDNLASLNDLIEQKIAALASDKKKGIQKIEMRTFSLSPKTLKYNVTFGIKFVI